MYGKIFDSIYDGTLYGQWEAIVTFQQMIVLADADGVVDMTPPAIAARTSIPLEIIQNGLAILQEPDPYSRTPGSDGRRIEHIDAHRPWGWVIVNYSKYKHLQDADTVRAQTRERVRKHRESKAAKETASNAPKRDVTDGNGQKRHTDTDTDTDTSKPSRASRSGREGLNGAFAEFWTAYPRKKSRGAAERAWLKIKPNEQLAGEIVASVERAKTSADWLRDDGRFIPHPATWLNAKGWLDEGVAAPTVAVDC